MSGSAARRATLVYGASHLVVDLACIATLLGVAAPTLGEADAGAKLLAIMTYDMLAFCMQLPCGALLDRMGRRRSRSMALLSFALVATGVLIARRPGLAAASASIIPVALGNALFHCVGGVEVLGESEGRAGPSGAFISTGAIGVFVGSMTRFNAWEYVPWALLGLLCACALAVFMLGRLDEGRGGLELSLSGTGWVAVVLLASTVALRSYTGMVMAFPWKSEFALAAAAIVAVVAGKAVGGYFADGVGLAWASLLSLGGAALAFLFSWENVAAGLVATFLFNFTMAITLSALAALLPRAHGLAFGIASFSLAIGALPALIGFRLSSEYALCALSVASLVLLELGLLFKGSRRDS